MTATQERQNVRRPYIKMISLDCWEVGYYNQRFKWVTLARCVTQEEAEQCLQDQKEQTYHG